MDERFQRKEFCMKYELYGDQQSNITILAIPALGERTEFYRPLAKQMFKSFVMVITIYL